MIDMDCKNLMIGDWVMLDKTYPSTSKKPTRLTLQDMIYIEQGKECEPIPLTAEILEKNNCEEYKGGLFNLQDPSLGLSLESDGFVIGQDYGERGGFEGFIEIKYVHELQHALRLCGLNELADNFKV